MAQPRDFGFGPDESSARTVARTFLAESVPIERVRALVGADPDAYVTGTGAPPVAYDASMWREVVKLDWPAMAVPERARGAGMKMVAIAALVEEVGRVALPSALLATFFATFLLRRCQTPAADAWLLRVVGGVPAAVAIQRDDGAYGPDVAAIAAKGVRGTAILSGTAHFVQEARKAAFYVVAARSGRGTGLYAIHADAPGLVVRPDRLVDGTRDQARLVFENVSAEVIAEAPAGGEVLRSALPEIWTTVSADLVGTAEWLLQATAAYAKVREQFGRPIGFFQAVKHPLVDAMIEIDLARSLTYNAACAIDSEPEVAERSARMAKAQASDAAAFAADRAVQLHGGIGFTWEYNLHIFFKRAKHGQFLFGDGRSHRRELAKMVLSGVAGRVPSVETGGSKERRSPS
jgi:alkylation response protein AidB-like acyl-CoA dehydrogenase